MTANPNPSIQTLPCEWFPAPNFTGKLLVVLHGRGDSSAGFRWLPDAFAFEELSYLLVNAPDEYYGGKSWYALPPDQEPGVLRSRELLDQLFAELLEQGYEPADLGLFGFSQGCLMTLEWGLRSELALGVYVGVSGYVLDPEALVAERNASLNLDNWLITHGRQDEALPHATTAQQIAELAEKGVELRFESYDKSHTIDPHRELPVLRDFVGERMKVR